jgi:hypothetical protein
MILRTLKAPLDELLLSSRFTWLFYLSGTFALGTLGVFLEAQGVSTALTIWAMVLLVIPFAVVYYPFAILYYSAVELKRRRQKQDAPRLGDSESRAVREFVFWETASGGVSLGTLVVLILAAVGATSHWLVGVLAPLAILNLFAAFKTLGLSTGIVAWMRRRNKEAERGEHQVNR